MSITKMLSRRQFIKLAAGGAAAAGTFSLFWEQEATSPRPQRHFIDLNHRYSSAEEVAGGFVRAEQPFLMACYSVFFPELLAKCGRKAIPNLKRAAEAEKRAYKLDHHRLDVLPAVAAAHLLPVTPIPMERDSLCREISVALSDKRREVREITLQNLITTISPNPDVLRFFSINEGVTDGMRAILKEAEDNQKLLTPATLCAEFLLNAKAILKARKAAEREIAPYEGLISMVSKSRAGHFWFVSRLVKLHELTFKPSADGINKLLPQSSETLMAWKNFPYARDYLSHLALIRARLMYTNLSTTDGRISGDSVMTVDQAKRALPKTIAFFKTFKLHELLDLDSACEQLPKSEEAFKRFLKAGDFRNLVESPERLDISVAQIPNEQIQLAKCVPFAQYCNYGLIQQMAESDSEQRRKFLAKAIDAGWRAAIAGVGAYNGPKILHKLVARAFRISDLKDQKIPAEITTKALDEVGKVEDAVEAGVYEGVDQQEKELGGAEIRLLRATRKSRCA